MSALDGLKAANLPRLRYRAPDGQEWAYKGKRAIVLRMLAGEPSGITQGDCLPWHTRLGSTIHAMRKDGLAIETELEGKCRHARYRLRTSGKVVSGSERAC